eukprot:2251772-Pleurochrysis_carterae.AAC.6
MWNDHAAPGRADQGRERARARDTKGAKGTRGVSKKEGKEESQGEGKGESKGEGEGEGRREGEGEGTGEGEEEEEGEGKGAERERKRERVKERERERGEGEGDGEGPEGKKGGTWVVREEREGAIERESGGLSEPER